MQAPRRFIVITSINEIGSAVEKFASFPNWKVVLVGDMKGPDSIDHPNIDFLSFERQLELPFKYVEHCPQNHYSRKNIGYLYAISQGAATIAESDDDNLPTDSWSDHPGFEQKEIKVFSGDGFFNTYQEFCDKKIWPRGLPLDVIDHPTRSSSIRETADIGVWQFLSDGDPDVDATYRLTRSENLPITFQKREPIALSKGLWAPFNSQNTVWHPSAFACLYLPSTVTFRFTDILRSYVAQPILWNIGRCVAFGEANTFQDRNTHDLNLDFRDEVPMYLHTQKIVARLAETLLPPRPIDSLPKIYEILSDMNIVDTSEIAAVEAFCHDLASVAPQDA